MMLGWERDGEDDAFLADDLNRCRGTRINVVTINASVPGISASVIRVVVMMGCICKARAMFKLG